MYLGEDRNEDPTVVGVEVRTAPHGIEPWVRSYAVIDGGFEVMRAAWQKLDHVFRFGRAADDLSSSNSSSVSAASAYPNCCLVSATSRTLSFY
jgi:hypothetical protein